jgi:DNA-directed RNA polymerase subunit alpha
MPTATSDVLAELVERKTPDVKSLLELRTQIYLDAGLKKHAEDALASWSGPRERQGVLLYMLGQVSRALQILETEASHDFSKHFYARALCESGFYARAEKLLTPEFTQFKTFEAGLPLFRCQLEQGKLDDAEKTLKALKNADNFDILAARGELLLRQGRLAEAIKEVEPVADANPQHRGLNTVLGRIAQAAGDDDTARLAYERIAQVAPVSIDVLINLGTVYEDDSEYDLAIKCYETILKEYPRHARAKLYLRDALSSKNMYYDEDRERKEDKRLQILRTPVTDFELSVRSRNCLAKMKIDTLGDLILKTESELLSYKNFGETSLQEIKSILASKGLRLGMRKEDALSYIPPEDQKGGAPVTPGGDDVLARSIDTLELSVRSRRCMERLGIKTIGQISAKTEPELLGTPNFGQTSLNEVKQKLAELGLSLSGA